MPLLPMSQSLLLTDLMYCLYKNAAVQIAESGGNTLNMSQHCPVMVSNSKQ